MSVGSENKPDDSHGAHMFSIDLATFSILRDGRKVFTAPAGWEPVGQMLGELDDMLDAGRLDRDTYKRLQREVCESDAGKALARRKAWQAGGVRL